MDVRIQDCRQEYHMTHNRNTGRDVAMVAAGIAAGILGSRLLPPLVAMASGSIRGTTGDPFDLLISDHRQISKLLDQMSNVSTDSHVRRAGLFLALKRKLGKHALAEEDVVYPLLHGRASDPDASKDLYDDHADIKILLFEIEEALMEGREWMGPVSQLRTLVEGHIDEEEQNVFPRLRQMMDGAQTPKIAGQIRREEALIL
jgi:hemerythrin superfamily protein